MAKAVTYKSRFMASELDQLKKKMAEFQTRIYRAAKIDSITRAEAWVEEVSTDAGVRAIQRQVRGILAEANAYSKAWIEKNVPKAYQTGIQITKTRLESAGLKPGKVGVRQMNASAINYSIEQMAGDMKSAFGGITQKLNRLFREMHVAVKTSQAIKGMVRATNLEAIASRDVAQALVNAQGYKPAAEAMYKNFQKELGNGLVRVVGPSGKPRTYDLEYYTDMVSRTRMREAVTQGFKNSMIESGFDFVEVTAYGTDCEICGEYEGNIYSISGGGELDNPDFQGTLGSDDEPPFHPNCSHALIPYIPDVGEVISDATGTFEDEEVAQEVA